MAIGPLKSCLTSCSGQIGGSYGLYLIGRAALKWQQTVFSLYSIEFLEPRQICQVSLTQFIRGVVRIRLFELMFETRESPAQGCSG